MSDIYPEDFADLFHFFIVNENFAEMSADILNLRKSAEMRTFGSTDAYSAHTYYIFNSNCVKAEFLHTKREHYWVTPT